MDNTTRTIRAAWIRSGAYRRMSLAAYTDRYMMGKAKLRQEERQLAPEPYYYPLNRFQ